MSRRRSRIKVAQESEDRLVKSPRYGSTAAIEGWPAKSLAARIGISGANKKLLFGAAAAFALGAFGLGVYAKHRRELTLEEKIEVVRRRFKKIERGLTVKETSSDIVFLDFAVSASRTGRVGNDNRYTIYVTYNEETNEDEIAKDVTEKLYSTSRGLNGKLYILTSNGVPIVYGAKDDKHIKIVADSIAAII